MKKIILISLSLILIFITLLFTGCTEADRVSYNISKEADYFNVTRRIVVLNMRSDKPMFELIGRFSLKNNTTNELEVIVEVEPRVYKKHFIYLNDWTMYVVKDISGANVDKYKYEVNFLPEMIVPVKFTSND